jgi:hypothetical protein
MTEDIQRLAFKLLGISLACPECDRDDVWEYTYPKGCCTECGYTIEISEEEE